MALKKVAVSGASLSVDVTGSASVVPAVSGMKSEGQDVQAGGLSFIIAPGASNGFCTSASPFSGTIPASPGSLKVGGVDAVKEGDNVTVLVPGVAAGPSPCVLSVKVTVQSAGQNSLKST